MIANVREKCIGCGACISKCPQKCLSMKADKNGFLRPVADMEKCIDCGLCDKACPVLVKNKKKIQVKKVVAVTSEDNKILNNSSSGGAFYLLADAIIQKGGYVCGAKIGSDNIVRHSIVNDLSGLCSMLGSKYVQSDTTGIYSEIKNLLNDGKLVLFSGTPCEVGGLNAFLCKAYDNLFTVDLICHGVPSPRVWQKYVEFQENKFNSKVIGVSFRRKTNGWKYSGMELTFENDSAYFQPMANDPFFIQYLNNLSLRCSCYSCEFNGFNRCSDITIGDFWGVEKFYPELYNEMGVSLIIANTEKGLRMIGEARGLEKAPEVELNNSVKYNTAYWGSVERNKYRDAFIQALDKMPFDKAVNKYVKKIKTRKRIASYVYRIKKLIKK